MFLKQTLNLNKELIETTFALHKKGYILPDSYIIDVDTFIDNSKKIIEKAQKNNIKLYFMLKQIGRNPYLAKKLIDLGYSGAVVVDYKEALIMMENKIPIGNIGHLVQIPKNMLKNVVEYSPEVITVYSLEKISDINNVAMELGKKQGIMLRVYDDNDMIYSGQTAGFHLDKLKAVIDEIKCKYKNVYIKGVTSFPCFLYDNNKKDIMETNNLYTVKKAVEILENNDIFVEIINTPSATCCQTIEKIKSNGGNCGEPGHGLTGTTPMHAYYNLEEIPCVTYLSEISHNFMGKAYCFGGGHYRRSHVSNAIVGSSVENSKLLKVIPPSNESIDYHFGIDEECNVSDTVVMAFRFQIFVTRSDVVLVKGIHSNNVEIIGVYDSQGRKKEII